MRKKNNKAAITTLQDKIIPVTIQDSVKKFPYEEEVSANFKHVTELNFET